MLDLILLPSADCRILILALSAANSLSRILRRSLALLHTSLPPCGCISVFPSPQVLQRLRHPGIVCYEDSFIHKNRQVCPARVVSDAWQAHAFAMCCFRRVHMNQK